MTTTTTSNNVFIKDSSAILDYKWDLEDWLPDGDTLLSASVTMPDGLTLVSQNITTTYLITWIGGGTPGTTYEIVSHFISALGAEDDRSLIIIIQESGTNIDYLIPYVRLRLGDTDASNYKYTSEWIQSALLASIQMLGNWWNLKYLLDDNSNVYRNTYSSFTFPEPPIIEMQDNQIVALMATYIILEGSLENTAWDFVSWRDAEISFSNLESSRARSATLQRLWDELTSTMKIPTKRLARTLKGTLPGYKDNPFEVEKIG